METDERDELWHLLGKAKQIEPNPFLARNVLREIRREQASPSSLIQRIGALARKWKLSVAARTCAVILFALGAALNSPRLFKQSHGYAGSGTGARLAQRAVSNADYEIIAHLDELIALQENSLWTDASQD